MHTKDAYLTVFHAQYISVHLQSHFDTYFNIKDTTRLCYTFLIYGQELEKQKDFKNVMSFRGNLVSTCQLYKP